MIRQQTAVVLGLARAPVEAVAKALDLGLALVGMAAAKAPVLVMAVVVAAMLRKPRTNSSPVASKAAVTPKPEMALAIALAMLAAAKTPLMQPRALANAVTAAISLASKPARVVGLVNLVTLDSLDRITLGSPVIPVPTSNLVDPAQLVRPSRGRNKS